MSDDSILSYTDIIRTYEYVKIVAYVVFVSMPINDIKILVNKGLNVSLLVFAYSYTRICMLEGLNVCTVKRLGTKVTCKLCMSTIHFGTVLYVRVLARPGSNT